jgi:hypothetical protein
VDVSTRCMAKIFGASENLEHWRGVVRPKVLRRFTEWAERGEPVPLFRGMSEMVMTLLFHIFLGDEFAEKYAEELVPIVRDYESAFQKPETKLFPRWMSRQGRLLSYVERRMTVLVEEEIRKRLANPEKYVNNKDYLQQILAMGGEKYIEGTVSIVTLRKFILHIYSGCSMELIRTKQLHLSGPSSTSINPPSCLPPYGKRNPKSCLRQFSAKSVDSTQT